MQRGWTGLDRVAWAGLDKVGQASTGLDRVRQGCTVGEAGFRVRAGQGWKGLRSVEKGCAVLERVGQGLWLGLVRVGQGWTGLGSVGQGWALLNNMFYIILRMLLRDDIFFLCCGAL